MSITTEQAAAWFENRAKNTSMSGAREMFRLAAEALREKAEREDPKPLIYEELWQMNGEAVWLDRPPFEPKLAEVKAEYYQTELEFWVFGNECQFKLSREEYGKKWRAYRHKPQSNI